MYDKISTWIDNAFAKGIPEEVASIAFNLYEDEDSWSMEIVGCGSFDADDSDWACDEITDFDTRENPYVWEQACDWEEVQSEMLELLKKYLNQGTYGAKIKALQGSAVGFVDGDLDLLF